MLFCSKILCMPIFVSAAFWVVFGSLFAWELRLLMERRGGFRWPQQLRSVFSEPRWPAAASWKWGQRGESKAVVFGRDLGCVAGVRAVGRKGWASGWKRQRWVRPGGVGQGWGQAAGAGRAGSCKGSEGSKRGCVGWETGLWLRTPLGEEAFPPLLSCLAAHLTDLRVGRLRDYCFCCTTSFIAPVLAVSADKWLARR